MNKFRYRLIFSRVAGCLIPVAEISKVPHRAGSAAQHCPDASEVGGGIRPLALALSHARQNLVSVLVFLRQNASRVLLGSFWLPATVLAQVVADPSPAQRPNVTVTSNGTPMVEINAPNA